MLFAAGLGTRLRPLTDRVPKALVEVGGVPMLERVARRLIDAGADRLVINAHHHAEQIERYVAGRDGWGVQVDVVREEREPLETGGGLLHAAPFLRRDAPFFAHNADVVTDLPLREMYAAHRESGALATLAVMDRPTTRKLLFDRRGLLGRTDERRGVDLRSRPAEGEVVSLAFAGVHVISPELFTRVTERGVFSILDPYLRIAGEGGRILPFRVDGALWLDVGRPEQLEAANRALAAP
ncbi:MAG TPA: nucleotidyltransferase family protein [Longimicrobiaceae bacterium]|nr:nucleotidyltransferase family protein [Longimicrobiaceae bacterium]